MQINFSQPTFTGGIRETICKNRMQKICEYYLQGNSVKKTAELLKLSQPTIYAYLRKAGINYQESPIHNHRGKTAKEVSPQKIQLLKKLVSEGCKISEIAKIINFSTTKIRKLLQSLQIPSIIEVRANIVRDMVDSGLSLNEICEKTGKGYSNLLNYLKRHGVTTPQRRQRENIIKLLENGLRDKEIAEKLNISKASVKEIRLRWGCNK